MSIGIRKYSNTIDGGAGYSFIYNYPTNSIVQTYNLQELDIYGTKRVGTANPGSQLYANTFTGVVSPDGATQVYYTLTPYTAPSIDANKTKRQLGNKFYELSNHLGNVLVTVSDRKVPHSTGVVNIDYYMADILTAQDYYAFGAPISNRSYVATGSNYRFGFNGKENDNEVKSSGNQQDYGMRIYDPRLGKFLSVDPLTSKYPWYSPYQFAGNMPIMANDLDGAEPEEMITDYVKNTNKYFDRGDLFDLAKKDQTLMQCVNTYDVGIRYLRMCQFIGSSFETTCLKSIGMEKNNNAFYPYPDYPKYYFIPDAVHDGHYTLWSRTMGLYADYVFENSCMFEVKSTQFVELEPKYGDKVSFQFYYMIDYLANTEDQYGHKATDYALARLYLITPASSGIEQSLIDYATENRVQLNVAWTEKDPNNPNNLIVGPWHCVNSIAPIYPGYEQAVGLGNLAEWAIHEFPNRESAKINFKCYVNPNADSNDEF
jgi:RHS repeat-associated protein